MTTKTQEFKMRGDTLLGKLKELVHEGDIRRITIKNEDGHTLIEIPLTLGVVGRCCCLSGLRSVQSLRWPRA